MKRYRILNRVTGEWAEVYADSAQEACQKARWLIGDCWVRQYSHVGSGGWKTPEELRQKEVKP